MSCFNTFFSFRISELLRRLFPLLCHFTLPHVEFLFLRIYSCVLTSLFASLRIYNGNMSVGSHCYVLFGVTTLYFAFQNSLLLLTCYMYCCDLALNLFRRQKYSLLNMTLINFVLRKLLKIIYIPIQPPSDKTMMNNYWCSGRKSMFYRETLHIKCQLISFSYLNFTKYLFHCYFITL